MFDFMLDAAAQIRQVPHETVSEKLAVGGEVSLRGMATVFAVLILIWIIVELLHLLLGEKTKVEKVEEKAAPAPVETKIEEAAPIEVTPAAPAAPDYELIAVITAAVAAASGSSPNSFRVVSFKRANNKFSSGK